MKLKALLLIAGLFILVYITFRTYRILNIDKGLDTMVKNGAVILDVRTAAEYKMGHLKNSVNIPLSQLRRDSIPFEKNSKIITCCSHGLRSVKAVTILREKGFKYSYNGGALSDLEQYLIKVTGND